MIRGFCSSGSYDNKSYVVLSSFSECYNLSFIQSPHQSRIHYIDEHVKHLYSEDHSIGVITAAMNDRCIFISHLNCKGNDCLCTHFVMDTLEVLDIKKEGIIDHWKATIHTEVTPPFLIILVENGHRICFNGFNPTDTDVLELSPACLIRDCFLQQDMNVINPLQDIVQTWLTQMKDIDPQKVSQQLTDLLTKEISEWPKPLGFGLTLLYFDGQFTIHMTSPSDGHLSTITNDIVKPKGVISAFNFFIKATRKEVLDEFGSSLSNNDLNRILGQKWKEMNEEEKQPFHEAAENDRQRYQQDLKRFKKDAQQLQQTSIHFVDYSSKPLTAYNHFIHQEKQYIIGLKVANAQTRLGQHGGDRWNDMNQDERELYQVLREAET